MYVRYSEPIERNGPLALRIPIIIIHFSKFNFPIASNRKYNTWIKNVWNENAAQCLTCWS